jgi:iron complex outermembrane receptor protein
LNIKLNASTGYRSANLAELSSNGLHEGTNRFEIGNPQMKSEHNLNTEINLNYESRYFDFYSAAYLNMFKDYIYLAPTGTQYFGFDIYRFLQGDARLSGVELSMDLKPTQYLNLKSSFSSVTGKLDSGKHLPFIPANKLVMDVVVKPNPSTSCQIGGDFISAQNHPGDFETSTPSYWLLHASVGWTIHANKKDLRLNIAGDNLLNKTYYDHLSRFKNYGIYNMGINIYASIAIPLNNSTNQTKN